ncbi:hypothetical protein [Pontibacter actiniarum]|uniref:hypothetical protein n=1 Tax=Pontibacter actiniarum TaxID=323450 RepID=UPI00146FB443|nr:hypothetical protein [Pontibacter actiniarum]
MENNLVSGSRYSDTWQHTYSSGAAPVALMLFGCVHSGLYKSINNSAIASFHLQVVKNAGCGYSFEMITRQNNRLLSYSGQYAYQHQNPLP